MIKYVTCGFYISIIATVTHLLVSSYLPAKRNTVWTNSLAKPLAERLSKCLQTLQYFLRWIYSTILMAE